MNITLNTDDNLRLQRECGNTSNFIDVCGAGYRGLGVTLFTGFQYVEVRKRDDQIKIFTFPKKSDKKDYDFGRWVDAEVVYSCNEQIMHKD